MGRNIGDNESKNQDYFTHFKSSRYAINNVIATAN